MRQTELGAGEPRRRTMAGTCAAPSRGHPTARAGGCAGCPGREPAALAEPGREGEGRGSPWARTTGRAVPRCCGQEDDAGEGGERKCASWEKGVEQGTTAWAYRRAPRMEAAAAKPPPAPAGRARRVLTQAARARRAGLPRGGRGGWAAGCRAGPRRERRGGNGQAATGPRARGELGRRPGWAERGGGEERERKKRFFLFYFSCFSSNSSLECMIHKPSQSNKMHDSAWCIKQKKVFLGFTYTRSQTESRYNFGKDQGLARGKGKRKG
jgi:hypothetical protein